jgi:hypothetical protein
VSYPYQLILTNPGGELGDTNGWTNVTGTLAAITTGGGVNPHTGSYFFRAGASAATECYQDVAVPVDAQADVDGGLISAEFSAWQAGYTDADTGRLRVAFRNAGGSTLATYDGTDYDGGSSWEQRLLTVPVPAGTRTIRLTLIGTRSAGTNLDAYWDDIALRLLQLDTLDISSLAAADDLAFLLRPHGCVVEKIGSASSYVQQVVDGSGSGNHVAATGTARPTFQATSVAGLNGLPAVNADGTTDALGGSWGDYSGAAALTAFAVLFQDIDADSGDQPIIARDASGDRGWVFGIADGAPYLSVATAANARARRTCGATGVNLPGMPAVLRFRYNGATGELSAWVNGQLDDVSLDGSVPATIANDGPTTVQVFASGYAGKFDGKLAVLAIVTRAVPDAECETIEEELRAAFDLAFLEPIETSPDVNVHQGVATDGSYYYLADTAALVKRDTGWSVIASNNDPFNGTAFDHQGDPTAHDGYIYTGATPTPSILKFNASTLARVSVTDISATADAGSAATLAADADDGVIWLGEWTETTQRLLKYSLTDLSYVGTLALDAVVPWIQGLAYDPVTGYLYACSSGDMVATQRGVIHRIDPSTGHVRPIYRRKLALADDAEGMTFTAGGVLLWLIDWSSGDQKVYALGVNGSTLALPPTASVISATGGVNQITVSQVTAPENETSRALYVATSASDLGLDGPGAGATLLGDADLGTEPYVHAVVGAGLTRYYAEYATNANGTVRSNVASATTLAAPGVPVITGTANSDTQITITTTTPGSGATDHELWIAPDNDGVPGTFVLQADGLGATPSPVAVTGLDPETTYWFKLIASNAAGETESAPIPVDTLGPSLRVVYVTQTTAGVVLDYDADAVEVQFQTALTAETDFDPTIEDEVETDADDGNPFGHEITGLTASTAYRVRARSRTTPEGAWSDWTPAVTFTTSAAAGETIMGGFTAPTGFIQSGTIYPAWNLAFSPAHPQDWTATELAIAEAGGGWTVLATTATLPAGKIGTYSAGIDLSAYDDGLMRLRLKGQRSTGHTGTDYLVFYNNSAGSLTQTEEDFDQECWDARSVEGTGEYVLGRDGGPWENWPTLWSGNAGFYLPCYPATTDKIITSIRATAKAKAAASGDSGYLWWLNNEITGSGASLEIYNGDGVLRAKLTIIWGATWAVLPCENSQNLVGVIHATFDSPTESQWPHSVVHHAGTIGTQSNWYGRCPVWGDTVGMSISLNHVSGDTWHYAAGASSRGSQHWEGDFTLEGGIGCGAYAMVRPFRLGPSGFKGFVSANLVGLSMSGTEDCEGGDPPVASSSFEPEPPTFDVQTDCYDALLTVDSPAPIASVRYQITDVSGAVLVDTGWDPPAYVADEQGGPSWVAYHLQQGLDPGSYMALISAQIDSVTYESYPLPFTILGLSVDYWGGWDNRTVTA